MSDNVSVTKYDIFMNGIKCKTATTETMEEIIVTVPGGTYSFFIRAYDAANNHSDSSPVSPQGTGTGDIHSKVDEKIAWRTTQGKTTDDVTRNLIYAQIYLHLLDPGCIGSAGPDSFGADGELTQLSLIALYNFEQDRTDVPDTVTRYKDANDRWVYQGSLANATLQKLEELTSSNINKPFWPAGIGFTVTNTTSTTETLDWSDACDLNGNVTGYQVQIYNENGSLVKTDTTSSSNYTVTGLSEGTKYTIKVMAKDADNNYSRELTRTALPGDPRQKIVDLALRYAGQNILSYYGSDPVTSKDLLNNNNSLAAQGTAVDCSCLTSSLYYTIFGQDGNLQAKYEDQSLGRRYGGGADRQSQMGIEVENLENTDGTINYSLLKLGDLLFFDYGLDGFDHGSTDPTGPDRKGIYEHVAVYIGNGKYVDIIPNGCSINSSANSEGADTRDMNQNNWSYGAVHDMIITARRFIQDDGSIFVL